MKKVIQFIFILLLTSCGINYNVTKTEMVFKNTSLKLLSKHKNVIELTYGISTVSNIIFTDENGNWKLVKIKNGKQTQINLLKEPHFAGDNIVVETELALEKINKNTPVILDGSSIIFKYKYPDKILKYNYAGEIEDFKDEKFELNYLKIIQEVIKDNNL